jgi:hypothetical protein
MKEYLKKINTIGKHLKSCSSWRNSKKSISYLKDITEKDKDYVYEFYCYLSILKDLSNNYGIVYVSGKGADKHAFPRNPANKEGIPFFYITNKSDPKERYQVCAGTYIQSKIKTFNAPDISFQAGSASLIDPIYKDLNMIFDSKRKRAGSKNPKISKGQYAYFAHMIKEFGLAKDPKFSMQFSDLKEFNGNCLITNSRAYSGEINANEFHNLKEVEYFDDKLDLGKIKVT